MIDSIRSGSWLTGERVWAYALIMVGLSMAAIAIWIVLADDLIDRNGKPLGTDFSNVWSAGTLVLDGAPEASYDPASHYEAQREAFGGRDVPFYGWHYPPMFLGMAALLALFPYGLALALWMAGTLAGYLAAMRVIVPTQALGAVMLVALAYPAVFVNIGHGQNGFLTAALLGGALVLLDRKPVVAGVLIGLLAYKPQFGVLIPLVLAATGRWQSFAAAAITVLVAAGLSFLAFGTETWLAFGESTNFTRDHVLEAGGTGWQKIQSAFAAARSWGAPTGMAYGLQALFAVSAAISLTWLWRSQAAFALKAAALAAASLLATPYVLDYDMMVLAVALAFFAAHGFERGFLPYEKTLLAAVWLTPLIARSVAGATGVPLGFIAIAVLFILILHRAVSDLAATDVFTRGENLAQA
jgi:hypothetical protein